MSPLTDDPASFAEDMLEGFCDLYPTHVRRVPGGVVRAGASTPGKVAVIVGGGSGHYPAFCGVVGPGFADGAVVGNVFTSPSTADAVSVTRQCADSAGAVLITGNYAGDVMNFSLAASQLSDTGIPTRFLVVTDDIASAPPGREELRRGIAGDFVVFKVAASAAESGACLDEVVRLAEHTNARTRTLGVAFDGCTMPGSATPLFSVDPGTIGIGVGIHGEPGIGDVPHMPARDLAQLLVTRLLAEAPPNAGSRVVAVLNGLGRTKYEELFVLWRSVREELNRAGLDVVAPEVGELVTSLDMAGCSLTLLWLDDEVEHHWCAPADTPAFRRGTPTVAAPHLAAPLTEGGDRTHDSAGSTNASDADGQYDEPVTEAERRLAAAVVRGFRAAHDAVVGAEAHLADLDAVAGDGDHGRGMVRGLSHALQAASDAADSGRSGRETLAAGGRAWADRAGGTSGVLWGSGLVAAADALGPSRAEVSDAVTVGVTSMADLGGAREGDKTILDAALPFVRALRQRPQTEPLAHAWAHGVDSARHAAHETARLRPRVGRSRPLAERSLGSPDPGAVSFALIVEALGDAFTSHDTQESAR